MSHATCSVYAELIKDKPDRLKINIAYPQEYNISELKMDEGNIVFQLSFDKFKENPQTPKKKSVELNVGEYTGEDHIGVKIYHKNDLLGLFLDPGTHGIVDPRRR